MIMRDRPLSIESPLSDMLSLEMTLVEIQLCLFIAEETLDVVTGARRDPETQYHIRQTLNILEARNVFTSETTKACLT